MSLAFAAVAGDPAQDACCEELQRHVRHGDDVEPGAVLAEAVEGPSVPGDAAAALVRGGGGLWVWLRLRALGLGG